MEKVSLKTTGKIVLIGGSAGSFHIIINMLPRLTTHLNVAIIIVIHRKDVKNLDLIELLNSKSIVPVKEAEDKDVIVSNTIYIAPADYHLLIEKDGSFSLDHTEKINFSRPSIDVTFQTAAAAYGENISAILLSGGNADGVEGLKSIKRYGGKIYVQEPANAEFPYMPKKAMESVVIESTIKDSELAQFINSL